MVHYKRLTVLLDDEVYKALREDADLQDRPASTQVRHILRKHFGKLIELDKPSQ